MLENESVVGIAWRAESRSKEFVGLWEGSMGASENGQAGMRPEIGEYQFENFEGEEGSDVDFASGFLDGGCLMRLVLVRFRDFVLRVAR